MDAGPGSVDPNADRPGRETLRDPGLGISMSFPPVDDDRLRIKARVRSGRGLPPHVHPKQAEVFRVVEGEVELLVGLRPRRLRSGDEVTVPAGVSHGFVALRGDALLLNDFLPALDAEEAFRQLFAIAHQIRGGRLAALLDLAILADERPLEAFYLPVVPWRLQRAGWSAAAAVTRRLRGRRRRTP